MRRLSAPRKRRRWLEPSTASALDWLERRPLPLLSYRTLAVGLFGVLGAVNGYMLRDVLVNGPLWFRDYTLYGMQYGARQLFAEAIPEILSREPETRITVSPSWANGTDNFVQFFLTPEQQKRVSLADVNYYTFEKRDLSPNTILVMLPAEYERVQTDPKFKSLTVERLLNYPDGSPGFYFVRAAYADNVDDLLRAEREARRRPIAGEVEVNGQVWQVSYSPLGAGQLSHLFDGDTFTLVRGLEANPLVFEFTFPQPLAIDSLAADFGSMDDFTLTLNFYAPGADNPVTYAQDYRQLPPDPHVEMRFDQGPEAVAKIRLEIKHNLSGETAEIHVRELAFHGALVDLSQSAPGPLPLPSPPPVEASPYPFAQTP